MGDRAFVIFHSKKQYDISPVVYLHNFGGLAMALIEDALPRMRTEHVSYSCARFVGVCHDALEGNLGLGVDNLMLPPPEPKPENARHWYEALLEKVNAADWVDRGLFLVDVDTWQVTHAGSTMNQYGDTGDGFGMQEQFDIPSRDGMVQLPAEKAGE